MNLFKVGSNKLIYKVSDAAGNKGVEVDRTVNVEDTIAPVITVFRGKGNRNCFWFGVH